MAIHHQAEAPNALLAGVARSIKRWEASPEQDLPYKQHPWLIKMRDRYSKDKDWGHIVEPAIHLAIEIGSITRTVRILQLLANRYEPALDEWFQRFIRGESNYDDLRVLYPAIEPPTLIEPIPIEPPTPIEPPVITTSKQPPSSPVKAPPAKQARQDEATARRSGRQRKTPGWLLD